MPFNYIKHKRSAAICRCVAQIKCVLGSPVTDAHSHSSAHSNKKPERKKQNKKKLETLIGPVVKTHRVFRIHRLSSINYVQRIKAVNNLPLKLTLKYNCVAHQNRLKRSLLRQEKLSDGWRYLLRQPGMQRSV